jgi:hypothetical protein
MKQLWRDGRALARVASVHIVGGASMADYREAGIKQCMRVTQDRLLGRVLEMQINSDCFNAKTSGASTHLYRYGRLDWPSIETPRYVGVLRGDHTCSARRK